MGGYSIAFELRRQQERIPALLLRPASQAHDDARHAMNLMNWPLFNSLKNYPFLIAARTCVSKPAFRFTFLGLAFLLFCCGAIWSFATLGLSPGDLHWRPLALLTLLIVPSLFYGGLGLVLLASSARLPMPLGKATSISAYAYLAEVLPLPGGAIVRFGALMDAGGNVRNSASLVLLTAVLCFGLHSHSSEQGSPCGRNLGISPGPYSS
jgi:hypothetical protein